MSRNEKFVNQYIANLTESDGIAFDIGANHGMYTTLLADKFERVYAFEPHPSNLNKLQEKVQSKNNVIIHEGAIGTHDGKHTLFVASAGSHSLAPELAETGKWGHRKDKILEVDGWTLDSFSDDNVKFIKCDIEGGEAEIFFYGKKFFEQNKPTIILETHQVNFEWKILVDFFKSYGYTVYNDKMQKVDNMKFDSHYLIIHE